MPEEERRRRMEPMRQRVMTFDAVAWAKAFMADLQDRDLTTDSQANVEEAKKQIRRAVSKADKIAMFLDYDGTIRELERDPAVARPNAAVRSLLDRLRDRDNLDVTIISGRTPTDLQSFIGSYPFALVAEHGASIRRGGKCDWEQLDRNISYAWMDELLKVLRVYEASTPGSFIEVKRTSLVWHYRRADPEFGAWKAKQLAEELAALIANDPLHVRHGRKIVEITPGSINKGAAILTLLDDKPYDLIVIAGDDQTDESMFRLDLKNAITIKVGDGDTQAHYRLHNPAALRAFLSEAISS
jgi:trehalose 6-phosphate synthase/phosphatase